MVSSRRPSESVTFATTMSPKEKKETKPQTPEEKKNRLFRLFRRRRRRKRPTTTTTTTKERRDASPPRGDDIVATSSSSSDYTLTSTMKQTRILEANHKHPAPNPTTPPTAPLPPSGPLCSSVLERLLCGTDLKYLPMDEYNRMTDDINIPDDPSVQESIECVIAGIQQQQSNSMNPILSPQRENMPSNMQPTTNHHQSPTELRTPSSLNQCLLSNRSFSSPPIFYPPLLGKKRSSTTTTTTTTPSSATTTKTPASHTQQTPPPHCNCCHNNSLPKWPASDWPQRPLLFRPTPRGGTKITGIRFTNGQYLWRPKHASSEDGTTTNETPSTNNNNTTWMDRLRQHWGHTVLTSPKEMELCSHCMILPINNGNEPAGQTLVTEFESSLFSGTILVRLKDSTGTTNDTNQNKDGYFAGLHRRYQVVIRGQFKVAVPWTDALAGFQLERPAGKLPPKWIVNGALNVVRFFAPQLQTSMTGPRPYSLTPLGSTPQSLSVDTVGAASMEVPQHEPCTPQRTLLGVCSTSDSTMQRARFRKKHFDKLYASKKTNKEELRTDPHKTYTFEFLQHLLSFDHFCIELGNVLGKIELKDILDGQPLQIMASIKHPLPLSSAVNNRLWCFDIWHEMLLEDAKKHAAVK